MFRRSRRGNLDVQTEEYTPRHFLCLFETCKNLIIKKINKMSSTFKCWLIANFEIFTFVFTIPACIVLGFALGYMGVAGVEDGSSVFIWVILLFFFTSPLKRAGLDSTRYIMMFGLVFLMKWMSNEPGDSFDEAQVEAMKTVIKWFWRLLPVATVVGIWLARYAYNNFDEVVSRRMLYHNSNVSLFEYRWKYTWYRFTNISACVQMSLLTLTSFFR